MPESTTRVCLGDKNSQSDMQGCTYNSTLTTLGSGFTSPSAAGFTLVNGSWVRNIQSGTYAGGTNLQIHFVNPTTGEVSFSEISFKKDCTWDSPAVIGPTPRPPESQCTCGSIPRYATYANGSSSSDDPFTYSSSSGTYTCTRYYPSN